MAYTLYDINNKAITHHDLQDKGVWCQFGVKKEEAFVQLFGTQLHVAINPEKSHNKYAPDLLRLQDQQLGDVKVQNTPFFQAKSRYALDPQWAVVFNEKDFLRYKAHYANIEIYFWVDWQALRFEQGASRINVSPMTGVWQISFADISKLIADAPLHEYQQRFNDNKGNARGSYVLNLQSPEFKKVI
ncbi:hypothetical protein [Rufibacter sp. XAAS-G3-1]|uniref:hypothetical protein n=1 Tax=Rufibacter sp. XAAS-G3-1 TaxID=2729134 RepID=UPI0015E67847|nr:hypothetical protein [Rufibacter sp. XAAS-G3-1]